MQNPAAAQVLVDASRMSSEDIADGWLDKAQLESLLGSNLSTILGPNVTIVSAAFTPNADGLNPSDGSAYTSNIFSARGANIDVTLKYTDPNGAFDLPADERPLTSTNGSAAADNMRLWYQNSGAFVVTERFKAFVSSNSGNLTVDSSAHAFPFEVFGNSDSNAVVKSNLADSLSNVTESDSALLDYIDLLNSGSYESADSSTFTINDDSNDLTISVVGNSSPGENGESLNTSITFAFD